MTIRHLTVIFKLILVSHVLFISSCAASHRFPSKNCCSLKTISLVDRNGMTETISNTERTKQYRCVNFFQPQPYQKVLRIYQRNSNGDIPAYINSYHENGQPKQYLEIVNSRAYGTYKEWHPNGQLKLSAFIVGGEADICPSAEATWLFDGTASVWDEEGRLTAFFSYEKGGLEGDSFHYHPNGNIWKKIPYKNNQINGSYEVFLDDRRLFLKQGYNNGKREGSACQYWDSTRLAAQEEYKEDLLTNGRYL